MYYTEKNGAQTPVPKGTKGAKKWKPKDFEDDENLAGIIPEFDQEDDGETFRGLKAYSVKKATTAGKEILLRRVKKSLLDDCYLVCEIKEDLWHLDFSKARYAKEFTMKELKRIAKTLGVRGYSRMKEPELCGVIVSRLKECE